MLPPVSGMIDSVEDGWHDGVSIIFAILIVVNTSAYNDYNQSKQFRDLNKDKKNLQINVVRDSRRCKASIHDLVVGDIVVLSLGDQVPADGLLISGMSVVRKPARAERLVFSPESATASSTAKAILMCSVRRFAAAQQADWTVRFGPRPADD